MGNEKYTSKVKRAIDHGYYGTLEFLLYSSSYNAEFHCEFIEYALKRNNETCVNTLLRDPNLYDPEHDYIDVLDELILIKGYPCGILYIIKHRDIDRERAGKALDVFYGHPGVELSAVAINFIRSKYPENEHIAKALE